VNAPILQALGNWSLGEGPLHARLASALRSAIARGDISAGSRLPAERALARMLSVSRGTVAAAYARLVRDGIVEGRQGSGTYVRLALPRPRAVRGGDAVRLPRTLSIAPTPAGEAVIDLASATSSWLDLLSPDVLSAALADPGLVRNHGYALLGVSSFRRAAAGWLCAQGLATTEDQIVATSGAQQAIALVAALYVRRGDRVALEDPTYTGAIDALAGAGAALRPVPVDEHGLRTDLLQELAEREPIRLAYLVPTFHNPTGTVLSAERRRELARLATGLDLPLVDDMVMAGVWLDRPPPPPLASFDPEAPVLTVGSLSKLFWGGLRLGWIRAPEHLVPAIARLKAVADLGTSVVSQALGAALLGRAEEIAALRRSQLASNLALLESLLEDLLPRWSWERPAGGVTLWVRLPYGEAEEFAQLAARHGVLALPGDVASAAGDHRDRLRIPLLRDPADLEEGVRRLAAAWSSYAPRLPVRQPDVLRVTI
jgi:DNA-binding transcriptional MocR family regulator